MKEKIQVSVIVVTYNPDPHALCVMLDSVVCQKDVVWEVIVTDDGSRQKDFSWLPAYFDERQVKRYRLLQNPENMGTIRNILQGVRAAEGKYVYTISPGDLLFDKYVLRDFYHFAEQKNCELCFGNAVHYSAEAGIPKLTRDGQSVPKNPEAYGRSRLLGKMNFFFGDRICGASFFYKREIWQGYLQQAAQICRYAEDASTTALALGDGKQVYYFDRHITWYEDGSGISTNGSSKWNDILRQEYKAIMLKLKEQHPKDAMVQIAIMDYMEMPQWQIRMKRMLRYPWIMITKLLFLPKKRQRILSVTKDDLVRLQRMLSGEME